MAIGGFKFAATKGRCAPGGAALRARPQGYLKPGDIITRRIPLDHIAEGYQMFSAKLDNTIKPLIVASAT